MNLLHEQGFSELNTRTRQALVVNAKACTGCRTCETVCSMIKTGKIYPQMARIGVERDPFKGRFVLHICRQCSVPDCLKACPEEAIGISPRTGAVIIDGKKCDGCGNCIEACPYQVIGFDDENKQAFKCDLCGGQPNCVRFCPSHALGLAHFGPRREK
jgi:Fe-S-cluster-containing dehydrogenase component